MSEVKTARPMSPHLTVYRFTPTMAMSIMHRITGVALYVGTLLVAWWLIAAASGPEAFSHVAAFFGSIFGRLVLFAYSWVLIHHMLGGIRHLVMDTGRGLQKEQSRQAAMATLIGSMILTVILWIIVTLAG
ncbi:succinate dehydrogenase, cytochrome b556 subunit [Mangrovibrevibacter kandeliae]|uniref:succinate dehydrogenase, cytochrome b556 subunit n=1 Tax=Mangrovibrevibacter kandeliae TaxID=2968473 RepID=UPI0021178C5F|nr:MULTISPECIES: succinate dehydrogenase, cytochrome b556 subunit [unclassified Aurantimonas]MCQ8783019.1 succinate dehydrogenase, cytochrome b556 subunit [Aurantimonas sp. CSK15Z-1]MCW4115789.1 succinate dehydrogenase, cytochrome b556 subunit [Aurantimonas sp. MSK8Z-1]